MAIHYKNRMGKIYYLRESKTKTGKQKYFFSIQQQDKGQAVAQIPEGFEIYESPENAQVFLRKIHPKLITDMEKQLVEKSASELKRSRRYRVYCEDEFITIYQSNTDITELKSIIGNIAKNAPLLPGITMAEAMNDIITATDKHYSAMLRFCLIDKEQRQFIAQRFCFRGSIDDWIYLDGPDNLETLVEKYVSFLGTEEFYDLPFLV